MKSEFSQAISDTSNEKGGALNSSHYCLSVKSIATRLLSSSACVPFNFTLIIYKEF